MNKETIAAADFQRKAYAKPQIRVVEIKEADIICTSGGTSKFSASGHEFEDEEDW